MAANSEQCVRAVVVGAGGRMGRRILSAIESDAGIECVAGVVRADDPLCGQDLGVLINGAARGITIGSTYAGAADVVIDFSSPGVTAAWAAWAAKHGAAFLTGTTGLSDADRGALDAAAAKTPCLVAANTSVGVQLLRGLVREAAARLGADWDIEIVEHHHRQKTDAPSGTALALYDAARAGRDASAEDLPARHGRAGQVGARDANEIGVHAVRMGSVVGWHEVHFATQGEQITLSHRAESRDTFARGAVRAAKWLAGRPAGVYQMSDVIA